MGEIRGAIVRDNALALSNPIGTKTDAFAVCNFLGLHRQTAEGHYYLGLALRLVDQVHHVLGRHRPDDTRRGWIGGHSDGEGEWHPARGGLRIGKPLPNQVAALARYVRLAGRIDEFWCAAANRQDPTWRAHGDINAVMLATSLAPSGYLGSE